MQTPMSCVNTAPIPSNRISSDTTILSLFLPLYQVAPEHHNMAFRPYSLDPPVKRKKYTPVPPRFTDEQLAEFDRRTFENLCHYYKPELRKILKGTFSHEVLDKNERYNLGRRGLITRTHNVQTGDRWIVSLKAIEILETIGV